MTLRTAVRTTLATALAGLSLLPAGPLTGPAEAADQLPCTVDAVPGSEPLAPADTRANPPQQRMHVDRAHELARGRGTKVAVIDSGVLPPGGVGRVARSPRVARGSGRSILD